MSGSHTPGPWEYEPDDRYGSVYGTDAKGRDWSICDVGPPIDHICDAAGNLSKEIRSQAAANARLIAAAPELAADGQFLIACVRELAQYSMDEATARNLYGGHVMPALERLQATIDRALGVQS